MLQLKRPNENTVLRENIPDGKRIMPPAKTERRSLWVLLAGGLASVGYLIYWFITDTEPGYWPLYTLLLITVSYKLLSLLHEWYHYAAIDAPTPPPLRPDWQVDMLTTYCAGEPYDMVRDTLKAMVAVTYPHTTYLCDEANDPYLKQLCAELGVVHVYRGAEKPDAKAGNINYALRHHARGEICVILDPDHRPRPDFLDRTLPYFEDEKTGFVQCIQAYGNQAKSLIAKAAAEHTYHFYGPMMMSMHTYGTVQAIGANCTFRRAALDSIGGHAAGLSEDMHTAMRLHAAGWKSVYVPENLSRGLVPETLSAFYQQQLKWSKGTFDLLFFVFPRLLRHFTWRQALHYLTIPLFFLTGLVAAIDMILPIWALAIGRVPLHTHMGPLLEAAALVIFFLILNRLYVQKWTLDRREKGLHFWGGVLLFSTWWVYLTGFIYAILRIKVPYIPTPKSGELADEWRLSLPNLGMIGLSLVAIPYGLWQDWSPYSWFMAGLVATNVAILSLGVIIAQRRSTHRLYEALLTGRWSRWRLQWANFRYDVLFHFLRSKKLALGLTLGVWLLFGLYQAGLLTPDLRRSGLEALARDAQHQWPGMVWGSPAGPGSSQHIWVQDLAWGALPGEQDVSLSQIHSQGQLPYLRWRWDVAATEPGFWGALLAGQYDGYLDQFAQALEADRYGLYLAPVPPDEAGGAYVAAWEYVQAYLEQAQVAHVRWIWAAPAASRTTRWPTPRPGLAWSLSGSGPRQLAQQWQAVQQQQPAWLDQPYWLTGLAPDSLDPSAAWAAWPASQRPAGLLTLAAAAPGQVATLSQRQGWPVTPARPDLFVPLPAAPATASRTRGIAYSPDQGYTWQVADTAFFLKGVAYTSGHSWRDDDIPLVREVLQQDLLSMRAMGANTIRRYSPSVYDHNLLHAAERQGLGVLYGFWFDPRIDYFADTLRVAETRAAVLDLVRRWRDAPAILAWTLGDGTWEHLQAFTGPGYLLYQRQAYLALLEGLARDIHALDPQRPVVVIAEHGPALDQELRDLKAWVPAADIIGINATHRLPVAAIDSLYRQWGPEKPYFFSEFGPQAPPQTPASHGRLLEPSDLAKAQAYYQQWQTVITPAQGHALGGVAFAWRDRLDLSPTWHGLTDHRLRRKLGYYALKRAWTGDTTAAPIPLTSLPLAVRSFGDRQFEVRAVIPLETVAGYTFNWSLVQDEVLAETGSLEPGISYLDGDPRSVWVKTPRPARPQEGFRLLLHLTGPEGHVLTASQPLTVLSQAYPAP